MEEIKELRRHLREAESHVLKERRRREEEQRRREEAEESLRPQTLQRYLEAYHSLNLAIQDDFATEQEEIWDDISIGGLSPLSAIPSQHQLESVRSLLKPISSELGLRDFERDVVENAVQKLVDRAYMDPLLRSSLGLQGTVTFQSHTNLGTTNDEPLSEPMEHMSLGSAGAGAAASASASAPKPPPAPKPRRRARGKGNRADQFCIYRTSDGQDVPAVAIEYKAPHKLRVDEVATGLQSEIQPAREHILV